MRTVCWPTAWLLAWRPPSALEKAAQTGQVGIIGFDGQPEGKQAIRDGKIHADPIQFPDRMGVEIVAAIVRWSRGETLPPRR